MSKQQEPIFEEDDDEEPDNFKVVEPHHPISMSVIESVPHYPIASPIRPNRKMEDEEYDSSEMDAEASEESARIRVKKEKKIRKQPQPEREPQENVRRGGGYDKWTDDEKRTFWLGHMEIIRNHPLIEHSWRHWKVDGCFKKMEPLFQNRKTHRQIKSFDQRMKLFFIKRGMDIPEAIIESLAPVIDELSEENREKFLSFKKNYEKNAEGRDESEDEDGEDDRMGDGGLRHITMEMTRLNAAAKEEGNKIAELYRMICMNR